MCNQKRFETTPELYRRREAARRDPEADRSARAARQEMWAECRRQDRRDLWIDVLLAVGVALVVGAALLAGLVR